MDSTTTGDLPEEEELRRRAAVGIALALGAGASVTLGALAATALRPGRRSRPVALLLASTSGCMVMALLVEFLPSGRTVVQRYSAWGTAVVAATALLIALAEAMTHEPLVRLRREEQTLTAKLETERTSGESAPRGSEGTQLAHWYLDSLAPVSQRARASKRGRERRPRLEAEWAESELDGDEVMGVTRHSNLAHLRRLARKVREAKFAEESTLEAICRLTCHTDIVDSDVPLRREQFRAFMKDLVGTNQVRSDLIWHQLCTRRRTDCPTMIDLAAAVGEVCRGSTQEDLAWEDPVNYEVPRLMGWALQADDRLCGQAAPRSPIRTCSPPDGSPRTVGPLAGQILATTVFDMDGRDGPLGGPPEAAASTATASRVRPPLSGSPRTVGTPAPGSSGSDQVAPQSTIASATTAAEVVTKFHSNRARPAHIQSGIGRITPVLEAALVASGAGVLHLIAGVSVGLVAVTDFRTGAVFTVLFAVKHFSEGLLLLSGGTAGLDRTSRSQGFFTAALVGLCDFLGAVVAFAITAAHGVLATEVLAAVYFVNGGIFAQVALRKYLRAAVSFDPEKQIPTIAIISGMMVSRAALLVC